MSGQPLGKAVRTYALRIARRCFLSHFCSDDHPVYRTELDLVEMARSALQEQILASIPAAGIPAAKTGIESRIRLIARKRIGAFSENEDILKNAIEALAKESFEDLFSYKH